MVNNSNMTVWTELQDKGYVVIVNHEFMTATQTVNVNSAINIQTVGHINHPGRVVPIPV